MTRSLFARAVVALGLAACVASCAYEPPLAQVGFHFRFGGVERDVSQPFVVRTSHDWTVTLTAAQLSIGPLYFHNGAAGSGTNEDDGRVVAQVLAQFTVDALDPNLGSVENASTGITERAQSGEVRFTEAGTGPIADAAGAYVALAHLAGVAQHGSVAIPFDSTLQIPLTSMSSYAVWTNRQVTRIPVDFTPAEGGTLTLRVDPTHWLDDVVFDATGSRPPDFSDATTKMQLLNGLQSASETFFFTWE